MCICKHDRHLSNQTIHETLPQANKTGTPHQQPLSPLTKPGRNQNRSQNYLSTLVSTGCRWSIQSVGSNQSRRKHGPQEREPRGAGLRPERSPAGTAPNPGTGLQRSRSRGRFLRHLRHGHPLPQGRRLRSSTVDQADRAGS
uniref:(northern house mosquito) hypothetical protein n=1 Tax=Culex pipiens TaxID=7175 RepID=A0A8D8CHM8_CULPI